MGSGAAATRWDRHGARIRGAGSYPAGAGRAEGSGPGVVGHRPGRVDVCDRHRHRGVDGGHRLLRLDRPDPVAAYGASHEPHGVLRTTVNTTMSPSTA